MFYGVIGFIAVFMTLCSLEAKLRTIVKQNNRIIELLKKRIESKKTLMNSTFITSSPASSYGRCFIVSLILKQMLRSA
ncbi:hypothetical protein ASE51_06980 [Bacillus sp. Root147]|nr:hypothetical protein ASE51_06980 [Bacillus sp. Root147]